METYLQTLWGDQWHNVDMDIVKTAIKGIKESNDEHGAFWVGLIKKEENVLEVHKNLGIIGIFEDEPGIQYKGRGKDWIEIEGLFEMFLADKMGSVKSKLSAEK